MERSCRDPAEVLSKRSLHDLVRVLVKRSCGDVLAKRSLHDLVKAPMKRSCRSPDKVLCRGVLHDVV